MKRIVLFFSLAFLNLTFVNEVRALEIPFLDLDELVNELEDTFLNVIGVNRWSDLLNPFNNDSLCDNSFLDDQGLVSFIPLESGLCQFIDEETSIGKILTNNIGELNIPIPSKVQENIQQEVTKTKDNIDPFQVNSQVQAGLTNNTAIRAQTQIAIESAIGELGQQTLLEELNSLQQQIFEISNEANTAIAQTSTQDVLKSLTKIMARNSMINAQLYSRVLQTSIDNQYTNANLANISRSLDQNFRRNSFNETINNSRLIYINANSYLW